MYAPQASEGGMRMAFSPVSLVPTAGGGRPSFAIQRIAAPMLVAGVAPSVLSRNEASAKGDLINIQKQTLVIKNFKLQNGAVLPEVTIAYETYGDMASDGRNVILLTHGYTASQKAAGAAQKTVGKLQDKLGDAVKEESSREDWRTRSRS